MSHPILFFDGDCGLCDGFVSYVMERDRGELFRYATLQGQAAAERGLAMQDWRDSSFVLEDSGVLHEASDAVLRVLMMLGGGWRPLAWIGLRLPRILREPAYRFVARRRYSWFGKRETCRIPTPEERARFLD